MRRVAQGSRQQQEMTQQMYVRGDETNEALTYYCQGSRTYYDNLHGHNILAQMK